MIEASGLKKTDMLGLSDPFVEIRKKDSVNVIRTKVKKNTLKPQWKEECSL